jgi:hypothetical protein
MVFQCMRTFYSTSYRCVISTLQQFSIVMHIFVSQMQDKFDPYSSLFLYTLRALCYTISKSVRIST